MDFMEVGDGIRHAAEDDGPITLEGRVLILQQPAIEQGGLQVMHTNLCVLYN